MGDIKDILDDYFTYETVTSGGNNDKSKGKGGKDRK